MNSTPLIPPPRPDLPPGHLRSRKEHVLAEIMREPKPRVSLRTFARRRPRAIALAASACAVFAAAAVGISLTGGSGTSGPLLVTQTLRSPAWGAEVAGV